MLEENLRKVIVGHQRVIREVLITLFGGGHALLEGVPSEVGDLEDLTDLVYDRRT